MTEQDLQRLIERKTESGRIRGCRREEWDVIIWIWLATAVAAA